MSKATTRTRPRPPELLVLNEELVGFQREAFASLFGERKTQERIQRCAENRKAFKELVSRGRGSLPATGHYLGDRRSEFSL